jgi:hypothetical protein
LDDPPHGASSARSLARRAAEDSFLAAPMSACEADTHAIRLDLGDTRGGRYIPCNRAKRLFVEEPIFSLPLIVLGLALYFLPVYLSKLWTERHYPMLVIVGPTEEVVKKSFPDIRSFFK